MLTYRVDDMTCGHCASTITKAVRAVDAGAKVDIDLAQHLVMVEPTEADVQELSDAIAEAGYDALVGITGVHGVDAGTDAQIREIGDRAAAIDALIAWAQPGDGVVVAGKGHEVGQLVDGVNHHFDDREEVRRALKEKKH